MPRVDDRFDARIDQRELTAEVWDEFNEVVAITAELRPIVIDYLSLEADYAALVRIESDLQSTLEKIPNPFSLGGVELTQAYASAQRVLTNFLGAASAFRERTLQRYRERGGETSQDYVAFRHAITIAYDRSFAYRVLYNLRNYAQHHEGPVSILPISGKRTSPDARMTFAVKLVLRKDELCQSGFVNSKVRSELQAHRDPEFGTLALASEYMACHSGLMREAISLQLPRLWALEDYSAAVIRTLKPPEGAIPVIWEGDDPGDGENKYKIHHFSFDELRYLGTLFERLNTVA